LLIRGSQILKGHVNNDLEESTRNLVDDNNNHDEEKQNGSEPSKNSNARVRQSSKRKTNKRRNRGTTSHEASTGAETSGRRTRKGGRKKTRNTDTKKRVAVEKRNRRKKQGTTKRNRTNRIGGQKKPQQMIGATAVDYHDKQPQTIEDGFTGEPKTDKTIIAVPLSVGGSSAAQNFMSKFNQSWSAQSSGKPGNSGGQMKTFGSAGWDTPGGYGTTTTLWEPSGGAAKAWKGSVGSWGDGDFVLVDEVNSCPCTYVDATSWGGGGWGGSVWGTSAWGAPTHGISGKAGKSTPIHTQQQIKVCTCMPTYFPTFMPTYMPTT
jgi:hypothetical protein